MSAQPPLESVSGGGVGRSRTMDDYYLKLITAKYFDFLNQTHTRASWLSSVRMPLDLAIEDIQAIVGDSLFVTSDDVAVPLTFNGDFDVMRFLPRRHDGKRSTADAPLPDRLHILGKAVVCVVGASLLANPSTAEKRAKDTFCRDRVSRLDAVFEQTVKELRDFFHRHDDFFLERDMVVTTINRDVQAWTEALTRCALSTLGVSLRPPGSVYAAPMPPLPELKNLKQVWKEVRLFSLPKQKTINSPTKRGASTGGAGNGGGVAAGRQENVITPKYSQGKRMRTN